MALLYHLCTQQYDEVQRAKSETVITAIVPLIAWDRQSRHRHYFPRGLSIQGKTNGSQINLGMMLITYLGPATQRSRYTKHNIILSPTDKYHTGSNKNSIELLYHCYFYFFTENEWKVTMYLVTCHTNFDKKPDSFIINFLIKFAVPNKVFFFL